MKTIVFANNKGGVGKSTSAVAVAWQLSQLNKGRVLLIDLDDQGNTTETAGGTRDHAGITELLLSPTKAAAFRATYTQELNPNLDLCGASNSFADHQDQLSEAKHPERQLRDKLKHVASLYEYVIVDCPPALNNMNYNAFVAADWFVAVAEPEPLAKFGIDRIMDIAENLRHNKENQRLQCAGILFTRYNPNERGRVRQEVVSVTFTDYGEALRLPTIRRDSAVLEAQANGVPLPVHAPTSRAALDYQELALALATKVQNTPSN